MIKRLPSQIHTLSRMQIKNIVLKNALWSATELKLKEV